MISFLKYLINKFKLFPSSLYFKDIKFTNIKDSNLLIEIFMSGSYEEEMFIFFDYFDYDEFFDIGANIGIFSFYISKVKGWKTTAYEAYPPNVDYMKKIMKINNIDTKIQELAISKKKGKLKFYIPSQSNSSKLSSSSTGNLNEIKRIYKDINYKTMEVNSIPFSQLISSIEPQKKYLIKLDIEGLEYDAISSTRQLRTFKNIDLIIEFNINNPSNKKLFNLLKSYGFNSYLMTNKGLIKESNLLTIPKPKIKATRTLWRNHFFTKRSTKSVNKMNEERIGYMI